MRFSNEQKYILELVKIFLLMYENLHESIEKAINSSSALELFTHIFYIKIPEQYPWLHSIRSFNELDLHAVALGDLDRIKKGIIDFNEIMNALKLDLVNGKLDIIKINGKITEITDNRFLEKFNDRDYNNLKKQYANTRTEDITKGNELIKKDLRKKEYRKRAWEVYVNDITNSASNQMPYFEAYKVTYRTDSFFYRALSIESSTDIVPQISDSVSSSYILDVTKYVLVKYLSLFNSFERIRVCRNCTRLFLMKKYGYGIYCRNLCRVMFHRELENPDIRRCRARQNMWSHRVMISPRTVGKEDCEKCTVWMTYQKGGKCPTLLEKSK